MIARLFPQIVCTLSGLLMFLLFFSAHPTARALNQRALETWQIIFACALIVGVAGYVTYNVGRIARNQDRWYRLLGLLGCFCMPILALGWGIGGDSPFMWMFEHVQSPMQATVFALLAFFVASASLRGFRARTVAACVLLIAAVLVLLSRTAVISTDWLVPLADWVRNVPSMSARRAILVGIGLGSLTVSLRVLLGIERTWLSSR